MEDIVDFPSPGKRGADGKRGDDFFDLEGTMILAVQLSRGTTCLDVSATEHHQVSYLVCWGFLAGRVGVSAYLLLCLL